MQQKSIVAVLVALVVVLAGTTVYFALNRSTYAPSMSQTVPAENQSLAGKLPATTNQTTTNNQTATTNETANWKTYTNNTYKFSITYPGDCTPKEASQKDLEGPGNWIARIDFDNGSCFAGDGGAIFIGIAKGNGLGALNGQDPNVIKNIMIGGKKGINYDNETYAVSDGKYSLQICDSDSQLNNTLKKMVDSFKFN